MNPAKYEHEQSNCFSLPQAPFAENPGFWGKPLFPVSGTVATGWLDQPSVTTTCVRLLSQRSQIACLNRSGRKDNQDCLRKVEELGEGSAVYRNASQSLFKAMGKPHTTTFPGFRKQNKQGLKALEEAQTHKVQTQSNRAQSKHSPKAVESKCRQINSRPYEIEHR